MSLVHSAMFNDHLGPTPASATAAAASEASSHIRSRSFELIQEAKVIRLNNCKRSYSDDLRSSSTYNNDHKSSPATSNCSANKRARTAPPSPPYETAKLEGSTYTTSMHPLVIKNLVKPTTTKLRSRSLSPNRKFANPLSPSSSPIATTQSPITFPPEAPASSTTASSTPNSQRGVKLPSISDALNGLAPITSKAPIKLKPIVPTVSLDYFDTYKPTDENWRYGLLDKIAKESKHFHLNQYNYLNDHAKPRFDSKLSSKIQHPGINNGSSHRKINFPYESNYTYLNKTYLNDVKHYPEYLELAAESLLQLKERQIQQPQQVQQPIAVPPLPQQQPPAPPATTVVPTIQSLPIQPTVAPIIPQLAPYTFLHNSNIPATATATPSAFSQPQQQTPTTTQPPPQPVQPEQPPIVSTHKFIPITPPSSSKKSRSDLLKSPPRSHHHHHHHAPRVCISCGSDQSPCWRPSWSIKEGQLCNSCGLRYKKTKARCLNEKCKKIPAKGEWTLMQSKGMETFEDGIEGYSCIACGWRVEVLPKS
ncbi:Transcriptional regulatory protein ASH1 [Candida viswanathii]|uniref:Transcriptional regulatory protein ASH1 n=1 Tax=Candida viswanathii TaxID=5486 RepID=A0A367XRS1_9ASCO|nr:Transcriptional regulatory protein ASH1 [Candida viswanathii]